MMQGYGLPERDKGLLGLILASGAALVVAIFWFSSKIGVSYQIVFPAVGWSLLIIPVGVFLAVTSRRVSALVATMAALWLTWFPVISALVNPWPQGVWRSDFGTPYGWNSFFASWWFGSIVFVVLIILAVVRLRWENDTYYY
jgi:hypothetical protein